MSGIRLAFERYMNLLTLQRREEMLKWSRELSTTLSFDSAKDSNHQSSITPDAFMKLNPFSLKRASTRKYFRLLKRDLTSSTTRFFDNNYDILVNDNTADIGIEEDAIQRFNEIVEELKFFNPHSPESYTPDIISKVSKLFDWLYSNKQFFLAYQLLHQLSPNYNLFFKFNQHSKMIEVFDKHGTVNDLFQYCEVFKYDKTPNLWRKLERLKFHPLITKLINLSNVNTFDEGKEGLKYLLSTKSSDGLKYLTFKIAALLYRQFDEKSRNQLHQLILNLEPGLFKFLSPSLISQMYLRYLNEENPSIDQQYSFLDAFMKPHFTASELEDNSFQYKLISLLPKENTQILKFRLWFSHCYKNEKLKYDAEISPIIYLRNNKIHFLPLHFEDHLHLNTQQLSKAMSILIYTHSKYENKPLFGQLFFKLKKKLGLEITKIDKIGLLYSLIKLKHFERANESLVRFLGEDPLFESDETLNPILTILAKNKEWKKLENIYMQRYAFNETITKDQYITLFLVLSIRAGTVKIMTELWENYLNRGFEPNDRVLSSMIQAYCNVKLYDDALRWFTAYSHYNVELTTRSYSLMLLVLASIGNVDSFFKVLNELISRGTRLTKYTFHPIFEKLSILGDHRSIEVILTKYYPQFNLPVERDDTRWIMQAHFHAQRYGIITDTYLNANVSEIAYKDTLLALDSALKFSKPNTFEKVWKKCYEIHSNRDDLDVRAYVHYMSYWVRKHGTFQLESKLDEIKRVTKVTQFPILLFNQMLFSAIRNKRPWLTKKIMNNALNNDVVPSPKTYSMVLQSNVSMPWISRNSIDQTIHILEEFLTHRKEDRFGKMDDDINPMSLKLVIKAIIKYKGIDEGRRLFEKYVDVTRDNITDNIRILSIELILLGEEERWIEFDECYEAFLKLITPMLKRAKLEDEKVNSMFDESPNFRRLDSINDIMLRNNIDETKLINSKDAHAKIPTWIKKAHYDVWIYRLKQLEVAESLKDLNIIMENLIANGIVFSNNNLNETALFLSERPELLEDTVSFIEKYILPYHIKNKRLEKLQLTYKTDKIPTVKLKPYYQFKSDVYHQVMKNLSVNLDLTFSPEKKESFLRDLAQSPNKHILKNLRHIMQDRRHMRSSFLKTKKLRKEFYQGIRNLRKSQSFAANYRRKLLKVDQTIDYSTKKKELVEALHSVTQRIKKYEKETGSIWDHENNKPANEIAAKLIEEKRSLRGRMNALRHDKSKIFAELSNERNKSYTVGKIDLSKL
ncbi:hypothetical protein CANINC_004446 [Pichia inconspicua]|uniref:Uncharacterized protein n=1 Tax=Pichia inconspicua TaxID=52247 RepID=A0A4T0WVF8_9ASCO|nr:hypothetical protein CANINC_004446 [[Candida] inconspicua]